MPARPPPSEHRKIGRKIAALAGVEGSADAIRFRSTGVPFLDHGLIAAMGQPFRGWDSEADAVLWYLLRLYITGDLVVGRIPLGESPARDRERSRNQEILDTALPRGIQACVDQDQHAAEFDGHVHLYAGWRVEKAGFENLEPDRFYFRYELDVIGPLNDDAAIPLEIGYTDPTRTFTHLRDHGAVVRWPYGGDGLFLLALDGGKNKDLAALFETDFTAPDGHFDDIRRALSEWRYEEQVKHALSVSRVTDDEEINVVSLMAAIVVRRYPLAIFLHVSDAVDPPSRIVEQEDGWTKVVGHGVTAYAAGVNPGEDCDKPWDLISKTDGPYSRLMARVQAAVPGKLIAVPPTRARALLDTATGNINPDDISVLLTAAEALGFRPGRGSTASQA